MYEQLSIATLCSIWQEVDQLDHRDDWCGAAAELTVHLLVHHHQISAQDYQSSASKNFGGCRADPSHSYVVLDDGTILDPTITQFIHRGKPSLAQIFLANGYPRIPGAPEIAVVPAHDPFIEVFGYESHLTGRGWTKKPAWFGPAKAARNQAEIKRYVRVIHEASARIERLQKGPP